MHSKVPLICELFLHFTPIYDLDKGAKYCIKMIHESYLNTSFDDFNTATAARADNQTKSRRHFEAPAQHAIIPL